MGLFGKRIKSPVRGTAQIVACSGHTGEGRWQNCRLHLVVHIDGHDPYSAEAHQLAPRAKWPQPGLTVPVIVSKDDLQRVKVDFDEMPTGAERARQLADEQAKAFRPGMHVADGAAPNVTIIGDPANLPPEKRARVEQMLGIDLDGDGLIGGSASAGSTRGSDDRVANLERLAALHRSGALTDAEFALEKRRLLDS
jgi:hypothetical protein